MDTRMCSPMKRSEPFALLVPRTKEAQNMLKMRKNRARVEPASKYRHLIHHTDHNPQTVAKLDFAMLLGRLYLSFGSSRAANIVLPLSSQVSKRQFLLHFDLKTATLQFTDVSQHGTWIAPDDSTTSSEHARQWLLLKRATHRIEGQSIKVNIGHNIEFEILLMEALKDQTRISRMFEHYVRTVARAAASKGSEVGVKRVTEQAEEGEVENRLAKRRQSSVLCF